MSLKIRLARGGAKKRAYYRIVVADSRSPRDGRFIERVGAYDPLKKKDDPSRVTLDAEKVQAWLKKGAQPTDRVLRFLDAAGLMKREARNNPHKAEPGTKAKERAAARAAASGVERNRQSTWLRRFEPYAPEAALRPRALPVPARGRGKAPSSSSASSGGRM